MAVCHFQMCCCCKKHRSLYQCNLFCHILLLLIISLLTVYNYQRSEVLQFLQKTVDHPTIFSHIYDTVSNVTIRLCSKLRNKEWLVPFRLTKDHTSLSCFSCDICLAACIANPRVLVIKIFLVWLCGAVFFSGK